jgi:hypothetical protein
MVGFSETVIILTSNLGSHVLAVPVITDEIREETMDEVRTFFRPEFLNRLDEVIMFNALSTEDMQGILKLMLGKQMASSASDTRTSAAIAWMLPRTTSRNMARSAAAHHPALRARTAGRLPAQSESPRRDCCQDRRTGRKTRPSKFSARSMGRK